MTTLLSRRTQITVVERIFCFIWVELLLCHTAARVWPKENWRDSRLNAHNTYGMPKKITLIRRSPMSLPVELIERRMYVARGHKVMLDRDLAELYQVPTKAFNQAVKRNRHRFQPDFMLQLTAQGKEVLR